MARPTKINYEIVERKINKLIENKINGDRFPTFSQIIKATGGNANSLNKFIKQYREKYNLLETNSIPLANSQLQLLQQQNNRFAQENAMYSQQNAEMREKIEILNNKISALEAENATLKSKLQNNQQNNKNFIYLINLIQKQSAELADFKNKYEKYSGIMALELESETLKEL